MRMQPVKHGLCVFITLFFSGTSFAGRSSDDSELQSLRQQVAALEKAVQDANDRHSAEIKMLKDQTELLKQNQPASVSGPNVSPLYGIAQSFNPDISAIGDVLFYAGRNDQNVEQDQFQFRELELAFGTAVDPYGRADFFVSLEEEDGEWGVDLEEGYFIFDTLPYDLKARAGKFYSAIGKANQFHLHSMPWVDKPNVIRDFLGEEGMSEAGAELSWLVPNPWDHYVELILQVQNNGNEESFAGDQSNDLMYVTHLKNFFDIDNDSTIEVGGSFAAGANDATGGEHRTSLAGLDLTYKWRPAQQGLYKSVTLMNELLFSRKEQGAQDPVDSHGLYSSLEYQLNRRWSAFGRYDYSQFPDDDKSHENAYSAGLTFRQSEFCFWRVQYRHTKAEGGSTTDNRRNELFLQLNFGIGPHRAHSY